MVKSTPHLSLRRIADNMPVVVGEWITVADVCAGIAGIALGRAKTDILSFIARPSHKKVI